MQGLAVLVGWAGEVRAGLGCVTQVVIDGIAACLESFAGSLRFQVRILMCYLQWCTMLFAFENSECRQCVHMQRPHSVIESTCSVGVKIPVGVVNMWMWCKRVLSFLVWLFQQQVQFQCEFNDVYSVLQVYTLALLCLLRGCIALEFGLVSLGLHCFLRLSHELYRRSR